ncbi:MAG: peptide ABC transporter substrate-binding protein [Chloroflexota bacterium]
MSEVKRTGPFSDLHAALKRGDLSRREFTLRALALGVAMPVISFVLRADTVSARPGRHLGWGVAAQGEAAAAPAVGMDGKKRGEGGELKLLQWQAPTMMSPHVSTGTKDYLAASMVIEPLLHYLADGTLIPCLAAEVPTVENGGLSEDLKTVTYKLKDGVTWSDGQPFTADDVVFTYNWVVDPANASTSAGVYSIIDTMEAVDPLTVKVTFENPNANWFEPHGGTQWGAVYPKHILDTEDKKGAHDTFLTKPVGTGPYKVESFSANDQVVYVINENYREADKPFFSKVNLKGGGDAASAARAVLQTGDYHYAWNLQVEPAVLAELEKGGKGKLVVGRGTSVERIELQFADPNKEVDGQRAEKNTPNPVIGDLAVRQALNLAAPRDVISTQLYAGPEFEPPTANILSGIPAMASPNTSWEYNIEKGGQLLEEAGWKMDGDVRKKDGVELKISYATSINPVRQKTQAIIKQGLEKMGFKVELRQVDSGIYFDGSPGNEQNINHFYNDLQMYTNNATTPIPVAYMIGWYAGTDGENIAQKSNNWNGQNYGRYVSPEYDALFEAVRLETDIAKAAELFIQMNDILINEVAVIPLINRAADKYAIANELVEENVAVSDFEVNYWNIANWVTRS